jgi:hypothetical protein
MIYRQGLARIRLTMKELGKDAPDAEILGNLDNTCLKMHVFPKVNEKNFASALKSFVSPVKNCIFK